MDVKELRTFVTLARTMSYPRTAQALSFAPSTLNRHIQMLEQELGTKLFAKSGRGLQITEDGRAFAPYAQHMLETYEAAMRNVGTAALQGSGILIGGCEVVLAHCLVYMLSAFSSERPGTRLAMQTAANARVPDLVRGGAVEVGFYYSLDRRPLGGLQEVALFEEPVCLVASPQSAAAGRGEVRYEDLAGLPFAFPHDDCCAAVEILHRFRRAGVPVGDVTYLGVMQLMLEQVHRHHALLAVPRSAARHLEQACGLAVLDLREPPIIVQARALYPSERSLSAAARTLVSFSRCCREDGALRA